MLGKLPTSVGDSSGLSMHLPCSFLQLHGYDLVVGFMMRLRFSHVRMEEASSVGSHDNSIIPQPANHRDRLRPSLAVIGVIPALRGLRCISLELLT